MVKKPEEMNKYGLIGKKVGYSFSKDYFAEKFSSEGIKAEYNNYELPEISEIHSVFDIPKLCGLNITIPYKEAVFPYLDRIDPEAKRIGAVNTIKIEKGKKIGYNTDYYGFVEAIRPLLKDHHKKALILGSGGASKAVAYGLKSMNIKYKIVSRTPTENQLSYQDLKKEIMEEYSIIINCTPLGTFPKIHNFPPIPYEFLGKNHLLFDLIYNPSETKFLLKGTEKGAQTSNGLRMLELQAEKAWEIWVS